MDLEIEPCFSLEYIDTLDTSGKDMYRDNLQKLFGPSINWFIAGSFANPLVKKPNDIDIFFATQRDFIQATEIITSTSTAHPLDKSMFADTYYINGIPCPVQLIIKHFGEPAEIFKTMDLNVCKYAILPDGTSIVDPTARSPLQIDHVSLDTFDRYLKYYKRFNPKRNLDKPFCHLFNTYINNVTLVPSYYKDEPPEPMNKVLYKLFKTNETAPYISSRVRRLILDKIQIHTPELLL